MRSKYVCVILIVMAITAGIVSEIVRRGAREEMLYAPSEGVLSTGLYYMFIGNFDFIEFRWIEGFIWERSVAGRVSANSPTEAAELGQFYLAPHLRNHSRASESLISNRTVVARYCPTTDNWVIHWGDSRGRMLISTGPLPNIYSINRSTGNVVEYTNSNFSFFYLVYRGWRRPLDLIARRYWDIITDDVSDFFN